jgi:hypothetical protein
LKDRPKVHLEAQKTTNSQGSSEQKEQCWRCHNTQIQTILQSHSDKKQHDTATKLDMKTSEQNRRQRIRIHAVMPT